MTELKPKHRMNLFANSILCSLFRRCIRPNLSSKVLTIYYIKKHDDYVDGMDFIIKDSIVPMELYILLSKFTLNLASELPLMGAILFLHV